jgi:hypothetical protein
MGTLFLPGERSQPGTPDGICADTLRGVEVACTTSSLADLIGGIRLSDRPTLDEGAASSESCLVNLLGKLHIADVPVSDLESVGSTDLLDDMDVDADTALSDAFPSDVLVFDDPLPAADSGASTSAALEVLVISHDGTSDQASQDPL